VVATLATQDNAGRLFNRDRTPGFIDDPLRLRFDKRDITYGNHSTARGRV